MIPDWLAPWWNWWAGFTDLFDWEAVGALGTAGAFFAALYLADAANRDRRNREAATLLAVTHPITTSVGILINFEKSITEGAPLIAAINAEIETGGLSMQSKVLEALTLLDLPSVAAVDSFAAAKAAIDLMMKEFREAHAEDGIAREEIRVTARECRERLARYAKQLRNESDRVRRGIKAN